MFIPLTGGRLTVRLIRLVFGLFLFGTGTGFMALSGLGLPPWDVLHEGLTVQFGGTLGRWAIGVSFAVMVLWIPLRQRFGIGTILNGLLIGTFIDLTISQIEPASNAFTGWAFLIAGVLAVGIGSGFYIGANLGPGPRDGLMTGLGAQGMSIRVVRFVIEVVVLVIGILLGGSFGVGTVVFAIAMGPLVHFFLPRLSVKPSQLLATT